jgi:hypothetical protein
VRLRPSLSNLDELLVRTRPPDMRPEEEATLVLLVISVSNPFLLVNMVDFPSWDHDPNYC